MAHVTAAGVLAAWWFQWGGPDLSPTPAVVRGSLGGGARGGFLGLGFDFGGLGFGGFGGGGQGGGGAWSGNGEGEGDNVDLDTSDWEAGLLPQRISQSAVHGCTVAGAPTTPPSSMISRCSPTGGGSPRARSSSGLRFLPPLSLSLFSTRLAHSLMLVAVTARRIVCSRCRQREGRGWRLYRRLRAAAAEARACGGVGAAEKPHHLVRIHLPG